MSTSYPEPPPPPTLEEDENEKPWYKKWWGITLIVLGFLFLLAMCSGGDYSAEELSIAEARIVALESEREDNRSELEELEAELEDRSELESELEDNQERIAELESERSELESELETLESELEAAQERILELEEELKPEPEPEPEPEPKLDITEMEQAEAAEAFRDIAHAIVDRLRDGADDFADLDVRLRETGEALQEIHEPLEYPNTASPVTDWRYAVVWMTNYGVPGDADSGWKARNLLPVFNRVAIDGVPSAFSSGVHSVAEQTVPTETVAPGVYEALDVEGCYWERLDSAGNTVANNFSNAAPRVEVTIEVSDFAFNSERCGNWVEVTN